MNTEKRAEHRAERGTLKVVAGVNTRKIAQRFFGGRTDADRSDKLLTAEALLRLHHRKPEGDDERNLLLMLAAEKTGELRKLWNGNSQCGYVFRGVQFITLRGDVPYKIFLRLTAKEIFQDRIPGLWRHAK